MKKLLFCLAMASFASLALMPDLALAQKDAGAKVAAVSTASPSGRPDRQFAGSQPPESMHPLRCNSLPSRCNPLPSRCNPPQLPWPESRTAIVPSRISLEPP